MLRETLALEGIAETGTGSAKAGLETTEAV